MGRLPDWVTPSESLKDTLTKGSAVLYKQARKTKGTCQQQKVRVNSKISRWVCAMYKKMRDYNGRVQWESVRSGWKRSEKIHPVICTENGV